MTDDLFSDLALTELERLLAPEASRDEADPGLARFTNGLIGRGEGEGAEGEGQEALLEQRLLGNYLALDPAEQELILPRVHEWLIQRLAQPHVELPPEALIVVVERYFLFADTTVQPAIVALLLDQDERGRFDGNTRYSPIDLLVGGLLPLELSSEYAPSPEAQRQARSLLAFVLDGLDLYPKASMKALGALVRSPFGKAVRPDLERWAGELGGEHEAQIRRVLEPNDRER